MQLAGTVHNCETACAAALLQGSVYARSHCVCCTSEDSHFQTVWVRVLGTHLQRLLRQSMLCRQRTLHVQM